MPSVNDVFVVFSAVLVILLLGSTVPSIISAIYSGQIRDGSAAVTCSASSLVGAHSALCEDGNACTFNPIKTGSDGTAYCETYRKPSSAACTSVCHVADTTTFCDADSVCSSDNITACLGHCDNDQTGMDAPVETVLANVYDFWPIGNFFSRNVSDGEIWNRDQIRTNFTEYTCMANQRMLMVLLPFVTSYSTSLASITDFAGQPNSKVSCLDMLNQSSTATAPASCLVANEFMVDSRFMDNFTSIFNEPTGSHTAKGFSYTGRICLYRVACGEFNQSAIGDPLFTLNEFRKRSSESEEVTTTVQPERAVLGSMPSDVIDGVMKRAARLFESVVVQKEQQRRKKR